ncbi:hypothetical protein STEG23_032806 [Scotinomys teguina]
MYSINATQGGISYHRLSHIPFETELLRFRRALSFQPRNSGVKGSPSLVLYLPPCVLWLPVTSTSCLHGGLASSACCLALDSSSSFPCPAFRAITKSVQYTSLKSQLLKMLRQEASSEGQPERKQDNSEYSPEYRPENSSEYSPEHSPEYSPEYRPENSSEYSPENSSEYSPENSPEYSPEYRPENSPEHSPENSSEYRLTNC